MLRHALEAQGHAVLEARDQPEAVQALRGSRPSVVLSDLRLPDGDGFGVLRAAKELDPEMPVIVMTAFGGIQDAVAAMREGALDSVIMRTMDVLFAFPAILLALALIAVLGSTARNVLLAIGLVYIPIFARTVRAAVLTIKYREFVGAAWALGRSGLSAYVIHILPNALAPILVQATLSISTAILAEAALSFLGVGAQPPAPSWGGMLAESRAVMEVAPWTAVFPGLAIMLAVLSFNLLGDGIRDYLDPRVRTL